MTYITVTPNFVQYNLTQAMVKLLLLYCSSIWFTHNYVLNDLSYGIGLQFKSFVIIKSIAGGKTATA